MSLGMIESIYFPGLVDYVSETFVWKYSQSLNLFSETFVASQAKFQCLFAHFQCVHVYWYIRKPTWAKSSIWKVNRITCKFANGRRRFHGTTRATRASASGRITRSVLCSTRGRRSHTCRSLQQRPLSRAVSTMSRVIAETCFYTALHTACFTSSSALTPIISTLTTIVAAILCDAPTVIPFFARSRRWRCVTTVRGWYWTMPI